MHVEPHSSRPLAGWATAGVWALLDQAVNSGAGFALNLLLAMWLPPAEYGAFAVGFAIFLVIAGLHNALIIEPVSILGPSRHAAWLGRYLRHQVALHFLLTIPAGAAIAAVGAILRAREATATVGSCLAGLGVSLPFLLLFWTLRRFQYVSGTAARAAVGAFAYAAALLGLVLGGRWAGLLTPALGLAAMGVAGLAASAVLRLPPGPSDEVRDDPGAPRREAAAAMLRVPPGPSHGAWDAAGGPGRETMTAAGALDREASAEAGAPMARGTGISSDLRSLLWEQWRYGRWMIGASLLTAAGMQLYTVIAAATTGLEAAGVLRAMEILMLPMAQGITAIATLALPRLAADHGRGDLAGFSGKAVALSLTLTAVAILYEVALLLWHGDLERLVYGGRYAGQSWLIPVMGLIPVLTAASMGFTLMLKAAQLPAHYLVNGLVSSIVGLPLTLLLGLRFGVPGFAWGLVLAYVASLVALVEMYRRWVRPSHLARSAPLGEPQVTP